jgi:competence protein ComEA
MMERNQRLILFLAACLAAAPLMVKGRVAIPRNGNAPFLPSSSSGIKVRLEGTVRSPGVYAFAQGTTLACVIKLTGAVPGAADAAFSNFTTPLNNGTILELPDKTAKLTEISVKTMCARERMILGIPLDPDQMDCDDWCSVPGIGPVLAARIIRNRQYYGEFQTVEALKRVPGIGAKKITRFKKYFRNM